MPNLRLRTVTVMLAALWAAASCSSGETKPRGQLIIALSTDMSVTKDMDEVRVQVFREDGTALPDRQIPVLPAEPAPFGKPLPGTIAIVPPDAGGQQLLVRVSARHLDPSSNVKVTRIVREAVVKVPTDRIAMLRMPLRWLCDGQVKAVKGSDDDSFTSDCGENETCVAGACVPSEVDADALPDCAAEQVFGGGDESGRGGSCMNVEQCFAGTAIATPDDDCTVPLPGGAKSSELNVALVLEPESDGHCLDSAAGAKKGNCYLPLDGDETEGFHVERRKIVLPEAVCERQHVLGVAVSTTCPTKDLSVPVCGPWTGWSSQPSATGTGGATSSDGGRPSVAGSGTTASAGNANTAGGAPSGTAGAPPIGTSGMMNGTGGAPIGTGGKASSGGIGGDAAQGGVDNAGGGYACEGTKPTSAQVTSFSDLTPALAGNYTFQAGIPGGTYFYTTTAITLAYTGTALNARGTIVDYSGIGLYFNRCMDLSAYRSVSFNFKGNVGPTRKASFRIITNENAVVDDANLKGACQVPAGAGNPYDYCHYPTFEIPVTLDGGTTTVRFSDLTGGLPAVGVDPKQIYGLEWALDWSGTAYDADFT